MALKHRLHPGSYNPFFLLCQLLMWWSLQVEERKKPGNFLRLQKFGKLLNTSSKKSIKLFFLIALVCIREISIQKFPCHPLAQPVASLKVRFRIAPIFSFRNFLSPLVQSRIRSSVISRWNWRPSRPDGIPGAGPIASALESPSNREVECLAMHLENMKSIREGRKNSRLHRGWSVPGTTGLV